MWLFLRTGTVEALVVYVDFPAASSSKPFQVVFDGADGAPLQAAVVSWDSTATLTPTIDRFDLANQAVGGRSPARSVTTATHSSSGRAGSRGRLSRTASPTAARAILRAASSSSTWGATTRSTGTWSARGQGRCQRA